MKFRSKTMEIEANPFVNGATAPIGVRTREDGSCYVVTVNGHETPVAPGDWLILEDPPGDGTLAYPCRPEVFERRWAKKDWRIGGNVRPKHQKHPLFSCTHNFVVVDTRPSSLYKDGLLLIAVDDGIQLLEPADDWVTA